jgi:hypothetical protein
MSERGTQLLETAKGQIDELISLISIGGESVLPLPCSGREKLGDGTVAACALHTADNYHRIVGFLRQRGGRHTRTAKFLHRHGPDKHKDDYRADNIKLPALLDRLSAGRAALSVLDDLSDEQLDTVPTASEMKFCDGRRNLEQIVTNLLNHQNHNVAAVKTAIA